MEEKHSKTEELGNNCKRVVKGKQNSETAQDILQTVAGEPTQDLAWPFYCIPDAAIPQDCSYTPA